MPALWYVRARATPGPPPWTQGHRPAQARCGSLSGGASGRGRARVPGGKHGVWPKVGARAGRLIGLTQSSAQADFAWERQQQCRPEGRPPPPADDDGDCVIS